MKPIHRQPPTVHWRLALAGALVACMPAHGEQPDALQWKNRIASVERDNGRPRVEMLLHSRDDVPLTKSPVFRDGSPGTRPNAAPPESASALPWRAKGAASAGVPASPNPPAIAPPMNTVTEPVPEVSLAPPTLADPPPTPHIVQPPSLPATTPVSTPPPVPPPPNPQRLPLPAPSNRAAKHLSDELATKLRKPGDLLLNNTPLREALLQIGLAWNVNIVFGAEVTGAANGSFVKAPLHEILHAVLSSNGYGYQAVGESLAILKAEQLSDKNPLFDTAVIVLHAAAPSEVMKSGTLLSSPQGKIEAVESARTIVVVDLPERIEMIRRFAEQVDAAAARNISAVDDTPRSIQLYQYCPQYVDAAAMLKAVQALLSKDIGKAEAIPIENRLVVKDLPHVLALVDKMVRTADAPRPQVRITVLIYDVNIKSLERVGLNFKGGQNTRALASGSTGAAATTTSSTSSAAASAAGVLVDSVLQSAASGSAGTVSFLTLGKQMDVGAIITCLHQDSDSRLLADPSILATNRKQSSIQIVQEIPYQQLTQTQQGGNLSTTDWKQAGVTLKVTPYIAADGTLELDVEPEFSSLVGLTSQGQPIIDKRGAKTHLRVVDRQTVVMGGLRQRNDVSQISGIPGLMNRKGFGKLFRFRDEETRESELVVFITPEIVTPLYQGRPREAGAYQAGTSLLDHVPMGFDPYAGPPIVHGPPSVVHEPTPTPADIPVPPAPSLPAEPPPSFRPSVPTPPRPSEELPPVPEDYTGSGLIRPNKQTAGSFRVASRPPNTVGLGTPPTERPVLAPNATGTRVAQRPLFSRLKPNSENAPSMQRLPPLSAEIPAVPEGGTRTARPADDPGIRQATRPTDGSASRTSVRWFDGIFRR